LFHVPHS